MDAVGRTALVVGASLGLIWLSRKLLCYLDAQRPSKLPVRIVARREGKGGRPASQPPPSPVLARELEERRGKARAHVQFGQLLLNSGRLSKALSHFESAVELDERCARAHYELADVLLRLGEHVRAAEHYMTVLSLKPACVEAATNLAVAYLASGRAEDAVSVSKVAIRLEDERAAATGRGTGINSEAHHTLNAALRASGRTWEAHAHTRLAIEKASGRRCTPILLPNASTRSRHGSSWLSRRTQPHVTVVCVKWGTKYGADYVNKLFRAVRRHATVEMEFVCFTEDAAGIDGEVKTIPLPNSKPAYHGWWHKV